MRFGSWAARRARAAATLFWLWLRQRWSKASGGHGVRPPSWGRCFWPLLARPLHEYSNQEVLLPLHVATSGKDAPQLPVQEASVVPDSSSSAAAAGTWPWTVCTLSPLVVGAWGRTGYSCLGLRCCRYAIVSVQLRDSCCKGIKAKEQASSTESLMCKVLACCFACFVLLSVWSGAWPRQKWSMQKKYAAFSWGPNFLLRGVDCVLDGITGALGCFGVLVGALTWPDRLQLRTKGKACLASLISCRFALSEVCVGGLCLSLSLSISLY